MSIKYPKSLSDYKKLRFDVNNNKLSDSDKLIAESFITQWRVISGAYNLEVLVRISGKKQKAIANDLGIKARQLSEMITGCNSINNTKSKLAQYFNVEEDLLNDRQIRSSSKTI